MTGPERLAASGPLNSAGPSTKGLPNKKSHATHVHVGDETEQRAAIAVSPIGFALLDTALAVFCRTGKWPTAAALAADADIARPVAWTELKAMERLGCVRWGRTVVVLRRADGVFFVPSTERMCESESPRGFKSEALRHEERS